MIKFSNLHARFTWQWYLRLIKKCHGNTAPHNLTVLIVLSKLIRKIYHKIDNLIFDNAFENIMNLCVIQNTMTNKTLYEERIFIVGNCLQIWKFKSKWSFTKDRPLDKIAGMQIGKTFNVKSLGNVVEM